MGSISSLHLKDIELAWSKNEFLLHCGELFQACDLKSVRTTIEGDTPSERYESTLGRVKERIELMGYTLKRARGEFENPSPFEDYTNLPLQFDQVLEMIRVEGDVSAFDARVRDRGVHDPWNLSVLLERFDPYSKLRVLAKKKKNLDLPVTWDFYDVIQGGWVGRTQVTHGVSGPFLIVTEGSSDSKILQKGFELLRPNVSDFFRFVDMDEGYPFSGTGNIFNFLKGLISIRMTSRIIFLFDNDAEGVYGMKRCQQLNVPDNMAIIKLPDLEAFRQFPTIGPSGETLAAMPVRQP